MEENKTRDVRTNINLNQYNNDKEINKYEANKLVKQVMKQLNNDICKRL